MKIFQTKESIRLVALSTFFAVFPLMFMQGTKNLVTSFFSIFLCLIWVVVMASLSFYQIAKASEEYENMNVLERFIAVISHLYLAFWGFSLYTSMLGVLRVSAYAAAIVIFSTLFAYIMSAVFMIPHLRKKGYALTLLRSPKALLILVIGYALGVYMLVRLGMAI